MGEHVSEAIILPPKTEFRSPSPVNWSALVGVAAPTTALGAGLLYLAGYSYAYYLLRGYGLSDGIIEQSLQATLARGFGVLLAGAIFLIAINLAIALIFLVIAKLVGSIRFRPLHWAINKVSKSIPRPPRSRLLTLSLMVLSISGAAGILLSFIDFSDAEHRVAGGCKTCFYYETTRGQFVGLVLMQDGKTTVFRTRSNVLVVPNSWIKSVRPINRRSYPRFAIGLLV